MSDPNLEEAPLTSLSDDYIRDLEPESQRYDITLAQDFVISVLPNGIKTWAFIYDFQGRHRRKTLGVFPEMNFDDAKVALEKARASMLRMDEPTVAPNEFGQLPAVLGGSNYSPKKTKKPFNAMPLLKALVALVVLGALALAAMKALEWRENRSQAAEETEQPRAALPFASDRKTETVSNTAETSSSSEESAQPAQPTSAPSPTVDAPPEPSPEPARTVTPTANDTAANRTRPAAPVESEPAPITTTQAPTAQPVVQTPTLPRESAPVTTLTTTTKATAFGGRVSRSQLTSRVQDLEPTDTLGPEISYKNSGFTRVFYFTELREFGDGDVVHRWSLNGNVIDEVVLKVKKSWRWRTYSNKDITPGLNGEWKVETIDATGKILDTEMFTYDYQ